MAVSREPRRDTAQEARQADTRKAGLAQPLWVDHRLALGRALPAGRRGVAG